MNEKNVKQILKMQEENYSSRKGTVFGIFRIDDVKYNWITHTQEWTVSCTICGDTVVVPGSVGRDWQRGKGRNQYKCKKCNEIAKNSAKKKKAEENEQNLDSFLGKDINGWEISSRNNSRFILNCPICKNSRKNVSMADIINGKICQCRHKKDYSDPSYIGKRYGNLTVLSYHNGLFMCRCDCGFEKPQKPTLLEIGKVSTCGRAECDYHIENCKKNGKEQDIIRKLGIDSEIECYNLLKRLGYTVKRTKSCGDFGVDVIAIGKDGARVAIQVKNSVKAGKKTGIAAVQEVFAGGTYYDCDKFAVVSYTGYTPQAVMFAKKLNVMLLTERCELWVNPSYKRETERVERYNKHHPEINGIRKSLKEWCKQYGVSDAFVTYRMKKLGMTLEEALKTPKMTDGRPRKQVG